MEEEPGTFRRTPRHPEGGALNEHRRRSSLDALDRLMSSWTRVEDAPGVFTLRRDGVDVGTVSFLPTMPNTGESLFPTVLAGVVVAALNDDSATVVIETEMKYRAKGWPSSAAYAAQIEATRSITAELPAETLTRIQAAWSRRATEWSSPMTPEQMSIWQDEILTIATTLEQDPAA